MRVHLLISGMVQGVFYRGMAAEEARRRGLAGWVKNLPDGRVEAVVEGPEGDVHEMVEWCRHGPPTATVEDVEVREEEAEGLGRFDVAF